MVFKMASFFAVPGDLPLVQRMLVLVPINMRFTQLNTVGRMMWMSGHVLLMLTIFSAAMLLMSLTRQYKSLRLEVFPLLMVLRLASRVTITV